MSRGSFKTGLLTSWPSADTVSAKCCAYSFWLSPVKMDSHFLLYAFVQRWDSGKRESRDRIRKVSSRKCIGVRQLARWNCFIKEKNLQDKRQLAENTFNNILSFYPCSLYLGKVFQIKTSQDRTHWRREFYHFQHHHRPTFRSCCLD